MTMQTRIVSIKEGLDEAVELIKRGEVVVFPTETVYGLGANAFDGDAVRKIFEAKGRPMDNPLIAHIADISWTNDLAVDISDGAKAVMNEFMPGPITVILKRSKNVPDEVTAGLDTVGVRFPSHSVARQFIMACGAPLAAPSANTSTKISPTSAQHVFEDMQGRVPLILQGGECEVGIESTIVDMTADIPTILRPGAITQDMLAKVLGKVKNFDGKIIVAKAPGMKYKHYAPSCEMVVATSARTAVEEYDRQKANGHSPVILAKSRYLEGIVGKFDFIDLGESDEDAMRNIYAAMHEAQEKYDYIVCQDFGEEGLGASIMNRVNKASGGKRI
ncbi:MAG: threonylcarbamoyl-AMP synthase [Clostridia bacterium]|nr:threonylcarbamoyl-AMP synthase [Clostridia bacterium]